jgi:hypothetical protein
MIAAILLKLDPQHLDADLDLFSESITYRTEKFIKSKNRMIVYPHQTVEEKFEI